MSQEKTKRSGTHDQQNEPVKFGDVFPAVQGELASKAVAPKDATVMQTAESGVAGQNLKRGVAATMQSTAAQNQSAGHVGPNDMNIVQDDVTVTETDLPGRRVFTESVGRRVVGEYIQRAPLAAPSTVESGGGITIGEALEATVLTAGEKPVEWGDAAAIQTAETRATGGPNIAPSGVAAEAQSAAAFNARTMNNEDKTTLRDVLTGATWKLSEDKPATLQDTAEGVTDAEMRNDRYLTTHPTGVAAQNEGNDMTK